MSAVLVHDTAWKRQSTIKEHHMGLGQTIGHRTVGVTALLGVALVVAACGSSSKSTSSANSPASAAPSTYTSTGVAVGTTKSSLGTYLTGASGRALYIWVADASGKSSCSGACAATWQPLTTKGTPTAAGGAVAADLGTITRSDGSTQVTYKGRPLYYFAGDNAAGMTTGQGSNQFGAKWWLVGPSGGTVSASSASKPASSASTPSSSSGSSTGGSSGGSSSGGTWG